MAFAQVTLATLQAELKVKWDNVPFWSDEEARTALNEGLHMWNSITGYWRQRTTVDAPPGDNYVPIPGVLAYKSRFQLPDGTVVAPSSLIGLDCGRPSWEGETTTTTGCPSTVKMWAPVSIDLVVIWPASTPGVTLTIDGMAQTPVLVNPGDFVDLGQEEHNQLLGYALHAAAFKLGGEIFESTMPLYKSWITAAGERNAQFKASSLYRRVLNIDEGREALPLRAGPRATPGQRL